MKYTDRIYGKVEINEPVVLDLIESPSVQRLKGVDQSGYYEPYFPGTKHTRFEHSVGDYILLEKYGASLEERIFGLLHDVSHAAFSHAADYYFSGGSEKEQSHQDSSWKSFIRRSEIPAILKKHRLDLEYLFDEKNFPLQEKPLPELCADRIDYSLRGIVIFSLGSKSEIENLLNHLQVKGGRWFFDDFESAKKYASFFQELNEKYYSGVPTALMFRTVGDYIKYSLEKNYIKAGDLYTTDQEVIEKISRFQERDENLTKLFRRMNKKVKYKLDRENFDARVFCKSRVIDPFFENKGGLKRLSEADPNWKKIVAEEMRPREYFIKFLE